MPWQTPEQLAGRTIDAATDAVDIIEIRLNADDPAIGAVLRPVLNTIRGNIGGGGPAPTYDAPDISVWDLREFAKSIHAVLLPTTPTPPVAPGVTLDPKILDEVHLFEDALGFYFTRLFRGDYVDRFGDTMTAPAVSRTVGDSEIASTLGVLIDVMVDFAVRSPVWTDPVTQQAAASQGPTANLVPTAMAFTMDPTMQAHYGGNAHFANWILPLAMPDPRAASGCGMDQQKLEIVRYFAQLAQQKASGVTGIALGSAGGVGVALGAFGKVSVGDNQTVQLIARTVLSIAAERIAAELAYRAVYTVPDDGLAFSGIMEQVTQALNAP